MAVQGTIMDVERLPSELDEELIAQFKSAYEKYKLPNSSDIDFPYAMNVTELQTKNSANKSFLRSEI